MSQEKNIAVEGKSRSVTVDPTIAATPSQDEYCGYWKRSSAAAMFDSAMQMVEAGTEIGQGLAEMTQNSIQMVGTSGILTANSTYNVGITEAGLSRSAMIECYGNLASSAVSLTGMGVGVKMRQSAANKLANVTEVIDGAKKPLAPASQSVNEVSAEQAAATKESTKAAMAKILDGREDLTGCRKGVKSKIAGNNGESHSIEDILRVSEETGEMPELRKMLNNKHELALKAYYGAQGDQQVASQLASTIGQVTSGSVSASQKGSQAAINTEKAGYNKMQALGQVDQQITGKTADALDQQSKSSFAAAMEALRTLDAIQRTATAA